MSMWSRLTNVFRFGRVARELDDLILHLRANEEEIGIWVFRTEGSADLVEAHDRALQEHAGDWLVREVRLYLKRTLKFHIHDEKNESKTGDKVLIVETRPLSKTKRWRLMKVLERAV